jgi:hypothetical protein
MTRIFNDPAVFKDEMTDGFISAYSRYVERAPGASGVMRVGGARHGKVSLVIGGGSGHYPAFCGVVGPGLADGAVIGDLFTRPPPSRPTGRPRSSTAVPGLSGRLDGEAVPGCDCGAGSSSSTPADQTVAVTSMWARCGVHLSRA